MTVINEILMSNKKFLDKQSDKPFGSNRVSDKNNDL